MFGWIEASYWRIDPGPRRIVFAEIFVVPQIHFEVQLVIVGHAKVFSPLNKMIVLRTISRVVEVDVAPGFSTLSRISSL